MAGFWMIMDNVGVWLVCLLTLAVFSFLYRDNPIYKAAEHIYVGTAAGYCFYQAFRGTIYPNFVLHVVSGARQIAEGTAGAWATQWRWGAAVLGLLLLSRLVPKWSWLSRWPMALVVGAFAGLNLTGFAKANFIDQAAGTMLPLGGYMKDGGMMPFLPGAQASAPSILNNLVLIVGVVTVLTYFFFSTPRKGALGKAGIVGIWFVMLTFGATYGSIVLARISLLIGRATELERSNRAELGYPAYSSAVLVVLVIVVWRLYFFKADESDADTGKPR
jgi:hypothetical protein